MIKQSELRCIQGKVLDVVVDLRKKSQTYGQYISIELSCENKKLFIPRGFAHGFLVLSETAVFAYKVDNFYKPDYDLGIRWNDPTLNIQWGIQEKMKYQFLKRIQNSHFFQSFKSPFF